MVRWINNYVRRLLSIPEYQYQTWFLNSGGTTMMGNWSIEDLTNRGDWEFDRIDPVGHLGMDHATLVLRRRRY